VNTLYLYYVVNFIPTLRDLKMRLIHLKFCRQKIHSNLIFRGLHLFMVLVVMDTCLVSVDFFHFKHVFKISLRPVSRLWLETAFLTSQHTIGSSIISSIKKVKRAIIDLAWIWYHFYLALNGFLTHDLPVVSRVLLPLAFAFTFCLMWLLWATPKVITLNK